MSEKMMKCPRDGEGFIEIDITSPKGMTRRIFTCGKCGGVVLSKEDVAALMRPGTSAKVTGKGSARCPSCGTDMKLAKVMETEIDICSGCGLIWLDRGELGNIMDGGKVVKYEAKTDGNTLVIRADPGSDLFGAIEDACRKNYVESAIILSGIGQLRHLELGYMKVDKYVKEQFVDAMELLALQGSIAPVQVEGKKELSIHMHATLANENFEVRGGHLFEAMVGAMAEVTLLRVYGMSREHRPSGLKLLKFH